MQELIEHRISKSSDLNDRLRIEPADEVGEDKSHHKYNVFVKAPSGWERLVTIAFQKGPIVKEENGNRIEVVPNGMSSEALLVVLLDHIRGFQSGPYSCRENAIAITHLESALLFLQKRTMGRITRGVEGKAKP